MSSSEVAHASNTAGKTLTAKLSFVYVTYIGTALQKLWSA
jgi:hypothetical protein